jgi:hypothetical protein
VRYVALVSVVVLSLCASASAQQSGPKEQILCNPLDGGHDVVIALADRREFGRMLNCISGYFIADLTPCAPAGAFGLSAPTGRGALLSVVDRWQDYARHFGGVTHSIVNARLIYFSGGFTRPEMGYKEIWSFSVDRLTANAELKISSEVIFYKCKRAIPQF